MSETPDSSSRTRRAPDVDTCQRYGTSAARVRKESSIRCSRSSPVVAPGPAASFALRTRTLLGTVEPMTLPRDDDGLVGLHRDIIDAWNRQDPVSYANCFLDDALLIGFDGSEMHGRSEIGEQLGSIFADHRVATYVGIVRSTRRVDECTALLHAVVGMVPPDGDDVMPDRHAVQLLVGRIDDGRWRAVSLQNTPAQLHGRPDLVDALTEELRAAIGR